MALLSKVMKYLFRSEKPGNAHADSVTVSESDISSALSQEPADIKAKVAAMAAALHHFTHEETDTRAKVAAIAAAIHHHESAAGMRVHSSAGLAAVVAAVHHHKNHLKK